MAGQGWMRKRTRVCTTAWMLHPPLLRACKGRRGMRSVSRVALGNVYTIAFGPCNGSAQCQYLLRIFPSPAEQKVLYEEIGLYNWTRATRSSALDSRPGHNTMATCAFTPVSVAPEFVHTWDSLWIARQRNAGSFQSRWGIASFELSDK